MPNSETAPQHMQAPHPRFYNGVVSVLMGPLLDMYKIEHRGAEVLSEIDSACIVAPAHRSNLDAPAVGLAAFEATGDQIHFLAKKELWKIPFLGRIITAGGCIKIDREKKILPKETRVHIERLVEGNAIIGIFPEGERKSGPTVEDIKMGAPYIAAKFGIPIIPVGVGGTEKGHRRPIRVLFGEVIHAPEPNKNYRRKDEVELIGQELVRAMQNLQDQVNS